MNKEHPFRDEAHLFYRFVDLKREISLEQRRWSISSNHRHSHCQSQPHLLSQAGERGSTEELTGEKLSNGRPRSQSSFSSSPRSSRGSLLSLLEECFDTIAALGPDVLIYATLRKELVFKNAISVLLWVDFWVVEKYIHRLLFLSS